MSSSPASLSDVILTDPETGESTEELIAEVYRIMRELREEGRGAEEPQEG